MARSGANTDVNADMLNELCVRISFTTQKVRNLVNYRRERLDPQAELSRLLNAFAQGDGNFVTVILENDEMSTSIVIQSSAQKALFERWCENLVLNWTYNLGFYLGTLL